MSKLTEQQINEIAAGAIRRVEKSVFSAMSGVTDPEQRFVVAAQVAASLFGTSGASFQIANPSTSKEEAARATLAHIGSMLNAYTN